MPCGQGVGVYKAYEFKKQKMIQESLFGVGVYFAVKKEHESR